MDSQSPTKNSLLSHRFDVNLYHPVLFNRIFFCGGGDDTHKKKMVSHINGMMTMPKVAKALTAIQVKRLTEPKMHAVGTVPGLMLDVRSKQHVHGYFAPRSGHEGPM